ncbi:ABC transporter permease [Caldinitratiruptor microaerophilus]|uniref:Transport permease protein n=1 Tax=Caldinitratiruptor microaerophilus TaxID=671077 RepID=A0AA35G883_9FIRM|nr:ABC transporter permease [Caldinitratiruptor microaerophilus]BDG59014.1 transport permease protein [Caldinitratiruptor microaerophilus]
MNLRRMWAIAAKEALHIRRDRATLIIILVMPVMMMLIFGYAVSTDVDRIPTAVLDRDHSAAGRLLVDKLASTGYFVFSVPAEDEEDLRRLVDSGQARAGLVIPAGFGRRLGRGEPAQVQMLIDGSDPLIARTALATAQLVVQAHSASLLAERVVRAGGTRPSGAIDFRPRVWYNPELDSVRFNLPGLLGAVLQNVTTLLTAFAIVRERERGSIEQLIVTPVRPLELMVGKLLPYSAIAFLEVALTLAVSVYWFGVRPSGSVPLLLALSTLFLLAALGFGLLISTVATNQLQAMQLAFALYLPSILLSGFMFPREAMPPVVAAIGLIFPLTFFLRVLRGIIVKGIGLDLLWRDVLVLAAFAAAIVGLAALRFRKRLG